MKKLPEGERVRDLPTIPIRLDKPTIDNIDKLREKLYYGISRQKYIAMAIAEKIEREKGE